MRALARALLLPARAEDTVTGFLLAGVGQRDAAGANFLVVDAKMPAADVAAFFDSLLARGDVGLIIVSQPVADSIRATVVAHTATIPMVRGAARARRGAARRTRKASLHGVAASAGLRCSSLTQRFLSPRSPLSLSRALALRSWRSPRRSRRTTRARTSS